MKKEIELSKDYLMLLSVQYVKNVSTGKKTYEIKSKIVNKKEYSEDENCIGEIQGQYFVEINVLVPKQQFLQKRYKKHIEKKIQRYIDKFFLSSKKLVKEWEQNEEIMKHTESYIEQMQ
ncbi:hypothetical protein CVD28_03555 [Bacillus sp. M6-12]|uniref:hypothetical protein n=1 Tax=Bacillus sp. M6-12 TaxID=2054166 RepID=UPI000C78F2E7|nr:hypothetical protein [Bacillus sp. M6-12]PLS19505.1 hypothetical protein CVD28_03555 [Bacillus sp. M6-12]